MTAEELAFQMGEAMNLPTTSLRRPEDMSKLLLPYARAFLAMRYALGELHSYQNGSPLPKYDHGWAMAMADSEEALAQADKLLEKP